MQIKILKLYAKHCDVSADDFVDTIIIDDN